MSRLVCAVAIAAAVVGCSSKSNHAPGPPGPCTVTGSSSTTLSCLFAAEHACDQVSGTMTNCEVADLSAACAGGVGSYSGGGCSTLGTVSGHCYYANSSALTGVPIAAGAVVNEYFYTAGWTLTSAQSYCATPPSGVWVP